MADARTLLRNERKNRRITHPNAVYSATGTLNCRICQVPIRSEAQWTAHLTSQLHLTCMKRLAGTTTVSNRKRKVDDEVSSPVVQEASKRSKIEPNRKRSFDDEDDDEENREIPLRQKAEKKSSTVKRVKFEEPEVTNVEMKSPTPAKAVVQPEKVDEDEWAAFQADIATEDAPKPNPVAQSYFKNAEIVAEPVTTAELESIAKSKEEELLNKNSKLQEEMDEEREDAQRSLEEEFEEMERLEKRMALVKQKHQDMLKKMHVDEEDAQIDGHNDTAPPPPSDTEMASKDEDNDSDEDVDEFDMWRID